jgi:hypothetical protein
MATHELKTWPGPFHALRERLKRFEWRLNDRDYAVGDVLSLREWDPDDEVYTGRRDLYRVTYMLTTGFGIPDGYCVMSIEPEGAPTFRAEPAPKREGAKRKCPQCDGSGNAYGHQPRSRIGYKPCGACNGTGTTEAHGTGEGT